jgi:hypothetical protein
MAASARLWLKTRFASGWSFRPTAWAMRTIVPTPSTWVTAMTMNCRLPAALTPASAV